MKSYVSRLSYEEEWEIMKMAIAKKDMMLIRNMLRDGYQLTLPVVEAVYRFMDKSSLMLIVNSYPEDFDGDCVLFLSERLDPQEFDEVMEKNRKKMEEIAIKDEAEHKKQIANRFEQLEKKYGDTPECYSMMVGETELTEYAIEKYGEDAFFKSLEKHGLLYTNPEKTKFDTWYLSRFSFEYLMLHDHIRAAAVWLTSAVCIHAVEDYDAALRRVVDAGGLKYLVESTASFGFGDLLKDAKIREEVMAMGAVGYRQIFLHAKEYLTLEDWYKWYELDPKTAMKFHSVMKVPKKWLLKHGYIKYALGLG